MQALRILAIALFLILSALLFAFGVLYASVSEMLFFHAAAVPEAAREAVRPIYFALMKLVGGASIGLALLGAWVTLGPLRAGAPLAGTLLALTYALPVAMAGYVAERLRIETGAPTSWNLMLVLLAMIALAFGAHAAGARRR